MIFVSIMECSFMCFIAMDMGDDFVAKDFWLANPYNKLDRMASAKELIVAIGLEWLIFFLFVKNLMTYEPQEFSLKEAIYWKNVYERGWFVKLMNEVIEFFVCVIALLNRSINAFSVLLI